MAKTKNLTGKDLKTTVMLLLQVVADAKDAEQTGDLQTLYERIQANAEDIENFLTHPKRDLFDEDVLMHIIKESEKV